MNVALCQIEMPLPAFCSTDPERSTSDISPISADGQVSFQRNFLHYRRRTSFIEFGEPSNGYKTHV